MKRNVELVNLIDTMGTKDYGNGHGEYAKARIENDTIAEMLVVERTLGVPARFALHELPQRTRVIVAHTICEIRDSWNTARAEETEWTKAFDPSYTVMWPAMHRISIPLHQPDMRSYEWLPSAPAYRRHPQSELLPADIAAVGNAYISAMSTVIRDQIALIPDNEPIAVSLSGGMDSSGVLAVLVHELSQLGRKNPVHCQTLDLGHGSDRAQAEEVFALINGKYPGRCQHHILDWIPDAMRDRDQLMLLAERLIEDYRILDLECAMAGILLYDNVASLQSRGDLPPLRYEFNGDGGNEVFLDYPLIGRGHRPILMQEIWDNPYLFLLGRMPGVGVNPVYSAGLSRGYTRTFNPARKHGVVTFSPLLDRRVIDVGARIQLRELAPTEDALHNLRGAAVQAGVRALTGIILPIFPKVMFQDGCGGTNLLRVSEDDSRRLRHELFASE